MPTSTAPLLTAARAHSRAVVRAQAALDARDEAIRRAAAGGMGVRQIAREIALDPSAVSRIIRRAR